MIRTDIIRNKPSDQVRLKFQDKKVQNAPRKCNKDFMSQIK